MTPKKDNTAKNKTLMWLAVCGYLKIFLNICHLPKQVVDFLGIGLKSMPNWFFRSPLSLPVGGKTVAVRQTYHERLSL